jgi:hypothetical protein
MAKVRGLALKASIAMVKNRTSEEELGMDLEEPMVDTSPSETTENGASC